MPIHRKTVNKKVHATPRDHLSMLPEEIISKAGVGIYVVQKGQFVYVSNLFQKITGFMAGRGHSSAFAISRFFLAM